MAMLGSIVRSDGLTFDVERWTPARDLSELDVAAIFIRVSFSAARVSSRISDNFPDDQL